MSPPSQEETAAPLHDGVDSDQVHMLEDEHPAWEPGPVQGPIDAPPPLDNMTTIGCCPTCGHELIVTNQHMTFTPSARNSPSIAARTPSLPSPVPVSQSTDANPSAPPRQDLAGTSSANEQIEAQQTRQEQKRAGEDNETQAPRAKRARKVTEDSEAKLDNPEFKRALQECTIVLRWRDVQGEALEMLLQLDAAQRAIISRSMIVWTEERADPPAPFDTAVAVGLTGQKLQFQGRLYPDKLFAECQAARQRPPFFLMTFDVTKPSEFGFRARSQAWIGNCSEHSLMEIVAFLLKEERNRIQSADDIEIGTFQTKTFDEIHAFIKGKSHQIRPRFIAQSQLFKWSKRSTREKFIYDVSRLFNLTVIFDRGTSAKYRHELTNRHIKVVVDEHSTTRIVAGCLFNGQAQLENWSMAEQDMYNFVLISRHDDERKEQTFEWREEGTGGAFLIGSQPAIARLLRELVKDQDAGRLDRHGGSGECVDRDGDLPSMLISL